MRMSNSVFSFLSLSVSLVGVGINLDDVVQDPIARIVTSPSNENVIIRDPSAYSTAHTLSNENVIIRDPSAYSTAHTPSNENVIIRDPSAYSTAHTPSNELVHDALWYDIIEL